MSIIDTKEQSAFPRFYFFQQADQNQLPRILPVQPVSAAIRPSEAKTRTCSFPPSLVSSFMVDLDSCFHFYQSGCVPSLSFTFFFLFFFLLLSLLFTSLCENFSPFLVVYRPLPYPSPLSSLSLLFSPFTSPVACC